MALAPAASWLLAQEARALLTRLAGVQPFALHVPMVPAAAVSLAAQTAIDRYLMRGRRELRGLVVGFLRWLRGPAGRAATAAEAQRRFTFLRLRFQSGLTQFDIFADALSQRSEHDNGVRLSGLDVVAADALTLPGGYYEAPPVICYLDRGHGAAIRRARTRLPGGGENPVAIIRVPRERMIGSGIASSLVHEVGHQGAALLDLVNSLQLALRDRKSEEERERRAWELWERWLSEIVADFWSVARVGVAATLGLLAVVSLPRAFVFRVSMDDPHPFPWIRVLLSCALGQALYPHPQWDRLAQVWEAFYPTANLDDNRAVLIADLRATLPAFVELLVNHRPEALRGQSLSEVMGLAERQPARLAAYYASWRAAPAAMYTAPPSLVFAVIGQARLDGRISPEEESRLLAELLTHWALRSTLATSATCATPPRQDR
jgi:hypothetical protein